MSTAVEILVAVTIINAYIQMYRMIYRRGFRQGVREGGAHVRAEFAYEALKHSNNPSIQSIYEKASRQ